MEPKSLRLFFGAVIALFAPSATVFGQGMASLQGTVTDPSGSVVAAAKITVTQTDTGLTRSASTGSQGNYSVPALPPTNYSLTVEAPGFRQFTRKGITLQ